MAVDIIGIPVSTVEASGDLSSSQFLFVTIDSNGQAAVAGDGVVVVGVLQDKPAAQGRACSIYGSGSISKVKAGAAVAAGAKVSSDAAGKAVTAASGEYIAGIALDAASAANQLISVLLFFPGRVA